MPSHFGENPNSSARRRVAPEWLKLTSQVGDQANIWSERGNLVAYIGKDGGQGIAPALFDPERSEIEVNTEFAFGEFVKPEDINDFTYRDTHFEWPKAAGLVMHEAMHARHTPSFKKAYDDLKAMDAPPRAFEYFKLLEESRIEANGVEHYPKDKAFLRASALTLVNMDSEELKKSAETHPVEFAINSATLALARVDAGVLRRGDVTRIQEQVNKHIALKHRKKMRKLWREFQLLSPADKYARMLDIAIEYANIVKEVRTDNDLEEEPQQSGQGSGSGDGSGGSGEGRELTEEEKEALGDILEALGDSLIDAETGSYREAQDQKRGEEREREVAARKRAEREQKENQDASKKVFQKDEDGNPRSVNSQITDGLTHSRLTKKRPPTIEERATANKISKALERAKYRDRIETEIRTQNPPGKLKTGAAMQGRAIEVNGGLNNADPWEKTYRRHVEDPNLTLGIMCDISGSMDGTMAPMASAVWIMNEAGRRIRATTAAVYYGGAVFPVLHPGQVLKEVNQYSASDSTEEFDLAFKAMDGALNLLNGNGARLLIICSDGNYRGDIIPKCKKWLQRCRQQGVAVVWLGLSSGRAKEMCEESGAHYVELFDGDIVGAANVIGKACEQALTKAGLSRA